MKIGIIETGAPPANLRERFGAYPAMMSRMLGDGFTTRSYDAAAGILPADRDREPCLSDHRLTRRRLRGS